MIIVHMKNYTEKKKKSDVFHLKKHDFSGSIGRGVLRVRNKFQAPTCDWKIFQSSDGKCVHQNSVNKFVPSQQNTKTWVFQDDFLHEYIPTPERS